MASFEDWNRPDEKKKKAQEKRVDANLAKFWADKRKATQVQARTAYVAAVQKLLLASERMLPGKLPAYPAELRAATRTNDGKEVPAGLSRRDLELRLDFLEACVGEVRRAARSLLK